MGSARLFTCKTCKKTYFLGYGSSGSWLDGYNTIAEYKKAPEKHKDLFKNQNIELCLKMHDGHDFVIYDNDYYEHKGDDLHEEDYGQIPPGRDALFIKEEKTFERINLFDD